MRLGSPSSRGFFKARLSIFDALWAAACPPVALYLTEAQVLVSAAPFASYWLITLCCTLLAFVGFRIRDGLTQYFTISDALDISKAVIVAMLVAGAILFMTTRLDEVPRSALLVHALILAAGLVVFRLAVRLVHPETKSSRPADHTVAEHILMIGATKLSDQYIRLLDSFSTHRRRVVALLDERTERIGRSISGVKVVGSPHEIEQTISEYAVHGIRIDRVIVGGDAEILSSDAMEEIRTVCDSQSIKLDFVPDLIGLQAIAAPEVISPPIVPATVILPSYFRLKRVLDVCLALLIFGALFPFIVIVCALALLDVGSPIFFWQQRAGRGGRPFLVYKVRTLRSPFDAQGKAVPDDQLMSPIGKLLRKTRLDEFPQLLNILIGDMSLIGPRPLLPEDQPQDASVRLMIRPGITGWAQVNGATSLTPSEKNSLDEWYVCNASFGLDLRIILKTIHFLFSKRDAEWPVSTGSGNDEQLPTSSRRPPNRPDNGNGAKSEKLAVADAV